MATRLLRIYADTSVFGGVFDEEFEAPSKAFFEQARRSSFILVTSPIVEAELEPAPTEVRDLFAQMLPYLETADITQDALELQRAYLEAGIVSKKYATDALQVAVATIADCDLIVSWNFKHIVHYDKIPLYNAVNTLKGYENISIYSPNEVIAYEDENA